MQALFLLSLAKLAAGGTTFALFCSGGDRIVTSGLESPRISWRVSSRFKQLCRHLLRSWLMQWWLGAHQTLLGDSSEVQDQPKGVQQGRDLGRARLWWWQLSGRSPVCICVTMLVQSRPSLQNSTVLLINFRKYVCLKRPASDGYL